MNMFTCAEFEILLADWLDEALAAPGREAERDAFLRHRESCAACALLAEDAGFAVGFMDRAAEVECPPVLIARILQATNAGSEFQLRGRGISGWINRTFAPVLQPRFAMSAAMTLMSLTIMARAFGLPERTFAAADLNPVRVWVSLDNSTHRVWDRAVKSYQSTPLVYEVSNQIDDWAQQLEPQADPDMKNENRN